MNLFDYVENIFLYIKKRFKTNTFDSLLWLIDIVPYISGFSLRKDTFWMPWWVAHTILLFYVYGITNFIYVRKIVLGAGNLFDAFVNITILSLIISATWWYLKKRPLLRTVLKDIDLCDRLSTQSAYFREQHDKSMRKIKWIILAFSVINHINGFLIDIPYRVRNIIYLMSQCVGLEPLTASPNREICFTILVAQELFAMAVVINYQALLLLVIAHTAVMYEMLSHEMMFLEDNGNTTHVKELAKQMLPSLIRRHSLTLSVIEKLKALYSSPLGVSFATNGVCMVFFCTIPIQEWLKFIAVVAFCFAVFFLYCFLCQRLINASEDFERCVYCCGWENFDVRERKIVYVMLCQAQKPVQILAADIIPVNMCTFATTIQSLYKLVTVLKM